MPENYRYLVREYLAQKQYPEAELLVRKRLAQEYYDFEATYLLAEIQATSGKPRDAVMTMVDALQKGAAIRGREVRAAGYDESATYRLLGTYLWQAGDYLSGGEMLRVALDAGATRETIRTILPLENSDSLEGILSTAKISMKLDDNSAVEQHLQRLAIFKTPDAQVAEIAIRAALMDKAGNTTAALRSLATAAERMSSPPLILAALANTMLRLEGPESTALMDSAAPQVQLAALDLTRFALPQGARLTSTALQLSRTGTVAARFDTGVFRTTSLLVRVRGTEALGMSPILVLRSGESELARLYLDGLQPAAYDLLLWPQGAPKSLALSLAFENDASDLVTKADRNIDILELSLH